MVCSLQSISFFSHEVYWFEMWKGIRLPYLRISGNTPYNDDDTRIKKGYIDDHEFFGSGGKLLIINHILDPL